MEEQYFITKMIILYIGAMLGVLLLAGYGIVSLSERIRRKRERKQLEKSLRKNGTKRGDDWRDKSEQGKIRRL